MAAAFPSADSSKLAHEWLSRPFRDYIAASRIAAQRDVPRDWPIESRGEPAILKEPGQSLIIATGHFSREAMTGVYLPRIIPKKLATVVAPLDHSPGARALRLRLQLSEMMAGIRRARGGDVEIVEVGGPRFVINLMRQLKEPGNAVVIATDALWPRGRPGSLERPFAGHASQNFALGAARLARMSQCPIVTCVPFLDDRNRIVIEWGEPIPPPADQDADARVTNEILDTPDRAIGLRPGQYVHPIGHDRRWSPVAQCWIAAGESERSPGVAQIDQVAAPRQTAK